MPYTPTDWVDGVTPVDAAHMDKLDNGVQAAQAAAEAAQTTASAAQTTANAAQPISQKAAANGYAPLDASYHLPNGHLPTRLQEIPENCADLDTLADKTGWYYFSPTTIGRPADQYGYCQSYAYAGALSITQIAYLHGSYDTFIRVKSGGVGGAWVKLLDASGVSSALPTRLSERGATLPGNDFDLATKNGWYWSDPASLHRPRASAYYAVHVVVAGNNEAYSIQTAYDNYDFRGEVWQRFNAGGTWGAWKNITPDLYEVKSAKGVASGYASLDAGTKVPVAQIPDLSATYQALSAKAAANGYASLDSGGKVPAAQLPAASSSVPPRLDVVCQTITDWNTAKDNGWYMGSGAANAPTAGVWYYGFVIQHNSAWVTQEVVAFAGDYRRFQRNLESGTWGPWTPLPQGAQYGSWTTPAMSNGSPYSVRINFAFAFRSTPVVMATLKSWTNSQQVYVAANNVSTTGFDFYAFNVVNNGNTCVVDWLALA